MTVLKGNSVLLRRLKTSDLDWLLSVENDESFWEVSHTLQPYTKAILAEFIANAHEKIHTSKQLRLLIEYKGESAGLIDLFDYNSQQRRAGVGILVLPKFQSKGIAYQALELLIDYAFSHLKIHQLYANITSDNSISLALFYKASFKLVGTKEEWSYTKKKFKDELLLQLINND